MACTGIDHGTQQGANAGFEKGVPAQSTDPRAKNGGDIGIARHGNGGEQANGMKDVHAQQQQNGENECYREGNDKFVSVECGFCQENGQKYLPISHQNANAGSEKPGNSLGIDCAGK